MAKKYIKLKILIAWLSTNGFGDTQEMNKNFYYFPGMSGLQHMIP